MIMLVVALIVLLAMFLYALRQIVSMNKQVDLYKQQLLRYDEVVDELRESIESAEQHALERANDYLKKKEKELRKDAIRRSQVVLRGKLSEQLAPLIIDFPYNPRDCRFIGSPFDLLVFNGMSEGELLELVLVEVKTGSSQLSKKERQVRDCIQKGDVRYETFRPEQAANPEPFTGT